MPSFARRRLLGMLPVIGLGLIFWLGLYFGMLKPFGDEQRLKRWTAYCDQQLGGDESLTAACAKAADPPSFATKHREEIVSAVLTGRQEEIDGYVESLIAAQAELARHNAAVQFKGWRPIRDDDFPKVGEFVVASGSIRAADSGFRWGVDLKANSLTLGQLSVPSASLTTLATKYCALAVEHLGACRVTIYGEIVAPQRSIRVHAIAPLDTITKGDQRAVKKIAERVALRRAK